MSSVRKSEVASEILKDHTPLLVQKEVNVSARTFLSHLAYSISCARFVKSRLSLFEDNEPFIPAAMLDRRFKMMYKPGKF